MTIVSNIMENHYLSLDSVSYVINYNMYTYYIMSNNRSEYFKQYQAEHRDMIKEACLRYYYKNKDKVTHCECCNVDIRGINFTQHKRTKKHMRRMNDIYSCDIVVNNQIVGNDS